MYCKQWLWLRYQKRSSSRELPDEASHHSWEAAQAGVWVPIVRAEPVSCYGPDRLNPSLPLLNLHSQRHDFTRKIKPTVMPPFAADTVASGQQNHCLSRSHPHRQEAKKPCTGLFHSLCSSAADVVAVASAHRSFTREPGFSALFNATNTHPQCR